MTSASTPDRGATPALLILLAAAFAWLAYRNFGLYPAIFADEWYYSKMSRLMPLGDAMVPSYLYLWLFSASNACGERFLDCVRIGNAVFFVGAAPFVYLIARRVAGTALALVVTLAALLAPLNMYTAFFMPESMYYFGFCVLSWIALNLGHWPWPRHALASGLVLGLMSLVKVHALFLLPALALYLPYARRLHDRAGPWLRDGLLAAALAALAMLAVKFGLGYVLAGPAALDPFGSLYSVTTTSVAHRSLLSLLAPAFVSARGHAMALAVLLAFPLALIGHMLTSRAARAEVGPAAAALQLYALLMLGAAATMTVAYTASIAATGPMEVVRLHQRYYSFVFPLLFIAAAAALGRPQRAPRSWPVALLLAAMLAIALVKLPLYPRNAIDGPDIAALNLGGPAGHFVVGLDLLILFLWALGSRLAAPLFLFGALPALLWPQIICTRDYLHQLVPGWGPDNAGLLARRFVPPGERSRIAVAGTEDQEMMRSQFHIDDKDTTMVKLAPGAPLTSAQIPTGRDWLLVLGRHALPEGIEPLVANPDFALVRLNVIAPRTGTALLNQPFGPGGLIASADGLSGAEPWGRWSDARRVVLRFNAPFPQHLEVTLTARAFAPNAGLPFTMRIGGHAATFRLGTAPSRVRLHFDPGYNQRILVIDVPHPVAPAELGQSGDTRKLGIGISALRIGALVPTTLTSVNQVP